MRDVSGEALAELIKASEDARRFWADVEKAAYLAAKAEARVVRAQERRAALLGAPSSDGERAARREAAAVNVRWFAEMAVAELDAGG